MYDPAEPRHVAYTDRHKAAWRARAALGGRFIITTAPGVEGARLSREGHWGNAPYPSVEAAEKAAKLMGATVIDHERGKRLPA